MQVYRVGTTGEGIDSEDLGESQPENGCVLIDLNTGEDNVRQIVSAVPQLPHILVTSTAALGARQLEIRGMPHVNGLPVVLGTNPHVTPITFIT